MLTYAGRLYVVQKGDTLQSIAKEFGTSIARIKELNYDLSDANPAARSAERSLGALKSICVFPDTCNE
jgi:spore germination protein YaaH